MPPELLTAAQMEAEEAAHDPKTCDDPTCREVPEGSEWFTSQMSFGTDGRIRFHHADRARLHRASYQALHWAQLCENYENNPDDFYTAHTWLNHHPLFHRPRFYGPDRPGPDTPAAEVAAHEAEAEVDCSHGLRGLHISVWKDDDAGGTMVHLEPGVFVWPSQMTDLPRRNPEGVYTYPHALEVIAETYEAAIVKLARVVHQLHGVAGNRP